MYISSINPAPVNTNSEPLDYVEDFTYLGSHINKDTGTQKDIQARPTKANGAFAILDLKVLAIQCKD